MIKQKLLEMKSNRTNGDCCNLDEGWINGEGKRLGCRFCENILFTPTELPRSVVIVGHPRSIITLMLNFGIYLVHQSFADMLREFAYRIIELPVFRHEDGRSTFVHDYVAWYTPHALRLNPYRGKDGLHWICPECGGVRWANGAADSVLARQLPGPPHGFFGSTGFLPLIDAALFTRLGLRSRFPELRARPIKVIEEPESHQILPGDPGWNGVLDVPFKGQQEYERWVRDWHGIP